MGILLSCTVTEDYHLVSFMTHNSKPGIASLETESRDSTGLKKAESETGGHCLYSSNEKKSSKSGNHQRNS